jgi:arylsulfatase A-like enzyme
MKYFGTERWQPLERPYGRISWVFTASPWLVASVFALTLTCALDLYMPLSKPNLEFLGFLLGLGLVVALLNGLFWSLVWFLLRQYSGRVAVLFWPTIGLGAGGWLAWDLGAFAKIHGRYRMLALGVMAACGVGGFVFGILCAAFQPTARHPAGFVLERRGVVRLLLACLLAVAAFGLQAVDRRFYRGQYFDAHIALRLVGFWCMTMAVVSAGRVLPVFRMTAISWALVIAGFVICILTLDQRRGATLQAFDSRVWPANVLRLSRILVDWDFDGYASLLGGGDCAPFNHRIHPGAREIPDNGVDDNCILGDAKREAFGFETFPVSMEPSPLDIVLITVDALRPDHLGVYNPAGYGPKGRATSPNLDHWAAQATVFENPYTSGGWTSVVMPSLLRGVYPRRLRWRRYFETNQYTMLRNPLPSQLRSGEVAERMFPMAFDDPHPPVAVLLKHRGMYTMAVTDDGYGSMLQRGTGIEQGFTEFREVDDLNETMRDDAGTATAAIEILKTVHSDRRFFLWVHFFGTHTPPKHHPGIREYGNSAIDEYDHTVAFFDSQVVRLLDALSQRSRPPAVFITGDHGEAMDEYGRQHGQTLEESVIRIPMIARVPGWPAIRVKPTVNLVDLVPTILSLSKSPVPPYLDGIDLAQIVVRSKKIPRVLFTDTWRFAPTGQIELDQVAAYNDTSKAIFDNLTGNIYCYDDKSQPLLSFRLIGRFGNRHADVLANAVSGYIEETGGTLDLSD